ncbi:MAG TPA: hypothetical protein VLT33_27705 [Labilithrix sp.]|nr:hypothetical protein [Labilithrix sp.]
MPGQVLALYEAIVDLATGSLAPDARRMREAFEKRTGAFGPEDPWFEPRSRAFWDDALTAQGFAALAGPHLAQELARVACRFDRAHRGVFVVEEVDERGAHLVDLWSGAELLVRHLDEAQAVTLRHAEGPMDARVVAGPPSDGSASLFVLPGALHHAPDALEPIGKVLAAARERDMETGALLDALLRMELVFRSSSRVKAGFAYRVESLSRARPG